MTREEQIDWLCRLRSLLVPMAMPKEFRPKFSQAISDAIKALEQEPCSDAISRQKALLSLTGEDLPKDRDKYIALVNERIKALSSVSPQEPKTGHWINDNVKFTKVGNDCMYVNESRCSECNWSVHLATTNKNEYNTTNYCPNCGARMESEEEA